MNDLSTLLATAPKVRLADGKKGRRLHLLRTLVDPWSLTQTVEHMFHFAGIVAVHQGRVELGSDGEAYMAVGTLRRGTGGRDALDDEAKDLDAEGHLENLGGTKQCVLDMDSELWGMAIEAYGIDAPTLPHRKTDDSTAPAGYDFVTGGVASRPTKRSRPAEGDEPDELGGGSAGTGPASPAAAGGSDTEDQAEAGHNGSRGAKRLRRGDA